jgi:nitroreductase
MSDFMELCLKRQSCRNFSDRPVEREKLTRCVEAARLAPSGCNAQPWSFVAVDEPSVVPQVAQCAQPWEINGFLSKAKAFIVVLEEHAVLMPMLRSVLNSQYFAAGDLGAAVSFLCLEAASLDLGSCIIGMYDRPKICGLLNLPATSKFGGLVALGYPADDVIRPKTRKPLEEIVRYV